jgi:hypothetical protein
MYNKEEVKVSSLALTNGVARIEQQTPGPDQGLQAENRKGTQGEVR